MNNGQLIPPSENKNLTELDLIFQILPDLYVRLGLDGTILDFKGKSDTELLIPPDQFVGKKYETFIPMELLPPFQAELEAMKLGKPYGQVEFSLPMHSGNRYYEARGIRLPELNEVSVLIRDMTEAKRIETDLKMNEERYRLISNVALDYVYSTSLNSSGKLVLNWAAGAFEKITGYTYEEYVANGGWRATLHPDDISKDDQDMAQLCKNQEVISDIRTITKDGRTVWVRSFAHPVWDPEQKKLVGIYGAVQDITENKKAEEALRVSEARYRFLFEQNPAFMLVYELDTLRILAVNEAFQRHYGYSKDEALKMVLTDLYPEEEKGPIRGLIATLRGYSNQGEWHHIRKDGSIITVVSSSHDLVYEGHTSRVAVITDVTERKHAEDKIRQMNVELERRVEDRTARLQAINDELEAFSYSVSHDLRAPLRGMSGYTHFLREDYGHLLPEEGLEFITRIETSARWMDNLINGLLKLSRLGRQPCERREVLPARMAIEAWNGLKDEMAGREIHFQVFDMPTCQADPLLLRQVYINLLSNAIKYTRNRPDASIQVGFRNENGKDVYWVKDNGIGFDLKYAHNIFEAFQRLPGQEFVEGHGIGLSIVQRIILKHGGEVWTEAQPERGATFFFTIPNEI